MSLQVHRYSDAYALLAGLEGLARGGLTPRELLFLAIDPYGAVHLVVPERSGQVAGLRVGEKLAVAFPKRGAFYHFDSIHRLREGQFLWNGDRRLAQPGNAADVAGVVTQFLRQHDMQSCFFGCTPHPPGTWVACVRCTEGLHDSGFVEAMPIGDTLVARRILDRRLWQVRVRDRLLDAQPVFESPLGNILLLERRVVGDKLVLTCEGGLVEVDVALFPWVTEMARAVVNPGFAVVGRIDHGAFAVSQGTATEWGIDDIGPAELVGTPGGSLRALAAALSQSAA